LRIDLPTTYDSRPRFWRLSLPYYLQLEGWYQNVQFGSLPTGLHEVRKVTQRQLRDVLRAARREQELAAKPNVVVEAQRYAEILDRNPELTKGRVAAELGVSRIRLYQMLNVLKLPQAVLGFILTHDTPEGRAVFTERRLRPLTEAGTEDSLLALFGQLLIGAGLTATPETHG
jgi:hypothetical protein